MNLIFSVDSTLDEKSHFNFVVELQLSPSETGIEHYIVSQLESFGNMDNSNALPAQTTTELFIEQKTTEYTTGYSEETTENNEVGMMEESTEIYNKLPVGTDALIDTTTPSSLKLETEENGELCKLVGYNRDKNDCSIYYMCTANTLYQIGYKFVCPSRFRFDHQRKICTFEKRVQC